MEWEIIDGYMMRAKVKGGWLVKLMSPVLRKQNEELVETEEYHIALTFVPDLMHAWVLE